MQARFYAPMYGRFLSPDPARDQHFEETQSWNIYSYVQNDPTMRIDPTGMFGLKDATKAVGSYVWSALTTHNPLYQAAAQVQDIVVAGINNAAGSNLPMVSNLGKTADANPRMGATTALAQGLKPAQDVMTMAVAGKAAGKVVEGVSGALQSMGGRTATATGSDPLPELFKDGPPKASDLAQHAESQGWTKSQTDTGPVKYFDENGTNRMTLKEGSSRTPGSENPHVELRNASGQRVNPQGEPVPRRSPGNHTPIKWDLEKK